MEGHRKPHEPPQNLLTHVGDPTPPVGYLQFWSAWHERLWAATPTFRAIESAETAAAGAPGVTHVLTGGDGVRVGCRLTEPAEPAPRGVVIELHGYAMPSGDPLRPSPALAKRGLTHVALRVRGYPGSCFDSGDLLGLAGGYISHRIETPEQWSVCGAVADVVNVFRALRERYGPTMPIAIHAESFGGGLAIVAASAIAARDGVHRMALGVPTLGDWAWRLANPAHCGGAGAEVVRALEKMPEKREVIRRSIGMFDALVHARRVTCPIICKIARKDPVVPPETVASIYNALGVGPGWKWRFEVEAAHTSAVSPLDLRRHALFERLVEEFVDPGEYPQTLMKRWEPVLCEGDQAPPRA